MFPLKPGSDSRAGASSRGAVFPRLHRGPAHPAAMAAACWKRSAQQNDAAEGGSSRSSKQQLPKWNSSSYPSPANMTATVISPFLEYGEVAKKVNDASPVAGRLTVCSAQNMLTLAESLFLLQVWLEVFPARNSCHPLGCRLLMVHVIHPLRGFIVCIWNVVFALVGNWRVLVRVIWEVSVAYTAQSQIKKLHWSPWLVT